MNDSTFFDRFNNLLQKTKTDYDLDSIHDALIAWFGENVLKLDPNEIKERIVIDAKAEGIDAILIDEKNFDLIFCQAETAENIESTKKHFKEEKLKSTLEGVRYLINENYKGKITPELENLADEYHELDITGDYKTKIFIITLKKETEDKKYIEAYKTSFPDIEIKFFDFDFIKDFYINEYLVSKSPPPEKISFKVMTNILDKTEPYKAMVFSSKAEELAKLYNDYRERIFQQNVRFSLGLKSKSINRQILDTAIDTERSKNFWYFNNGINIVCKEIRPSTSKKIINLIDAQIINGAQTTYSLYEAYKNGNLNDNAEVLIRVVETDDKNFADLVTLYTNSQNAIRLRDLCSNDEIQTKTQKIFKDSYSYFYERKRGEFESLYPTNEAKIKSFGKDYEEKIISNENAAQTYLAFYENKPAEAKSSKKRIFLKDEGGFYNLIFNLKDEILTEKFLLSWTLLKYISNRKKEYLDEYKKAQTLDGKERNKIYAYDFILHSEYYTLNLFKDFLLYNKLDSNKREDILKIYSIIKCEDGFILDIYKEIIETIKEYVSILSKDPTYYHNKFFKNEGSILLLRSYFKSKYGFVDLLG